MADQPNRAPFTPLYPELRRDSNGTIVYHDADGRWLPYNGPLHNQRQAMPDQSAQPYSHVPLNDKSRGGPDSPIEHAFQDHYQFALRPVQSNTAQHPVPNSVIDPALVALPGGPDLDLTDGPTIAKARGLKRADKVGGSRRKGKERADTKGKKRQRASSGSEDDSKPPTKRGRPAGSGNYQKDDVASLFNIIEKELPVGQKGWKVVRKRYNKWARGNGRPTRAGNALENKYKQLLKQKKPTGSATCPPEVKRAHELEDLINQRVGTRDLSDSEFDDSEDDSSDDDVEVIDPPSASVRTAVARRNPTPPLRRKPRASGADLANKLANVFDPESQKARDDVRSQRTFENTQILTLSQQLRDAQGVAEGLRAQNTILQNRVHDLERARDRAELKAEMLEIAKGNEGTRGRPRLRSRPRGHRSHKHEADLERVGGKIRCERVYPDGGAMTYWVSDPSTDDYEDDEDENHSPWDTFDVARRSRSRHAPSRRPISRRRTPTPGPSTFDVARRSLSRHAPSRRPISRRRTPTPGPSRLRALLPSPSPAQRDSPMNPSAPVVTGNAVELVVTPRRGPAVALVISPAKQTHTFDSN